jgi:hypothetical protein
MYWCRTGSFPEVYTQVSNRLTSSFLHSLQLFLKIRTYDTFPTFSLEKFFQPPPFEEFLEINFEFSFVLILHTEGYDQH